MRRALGYVLVGCAALVGCGSRPTTTSASEAKVERKPAAEAGLDAAAPDGGTQIQQLDESELVEGERSRDPFRSYAQLFAEEVRRGPGSQRKVVLNEYSLDELRLIGIVRSGNVSLAMLVDPKGKGYTVRRGQFVGRAEVVQGSGQGSTAYEINWRVDRIREGDVVFIREDPRHPDVPTASKVLALRPEGTEPEPE